MRIRSTAWLALVSVVAFGCGRGPETFDTSGGTFPDAFYEPCEDGGNAACRAPWTCLSAPVLTRPTDEDASVMACTQTCTTREECPSVFTSHCGEQRQCTRGVCSYALCR